MSTLRECGAEVAQPTEDQFIPKIRQINQDLLELATKIQNKSSEDSSVDAEKKLNLEIQTASEINRLVTERKNLNVTTPFLEKTIENNKLKGTSQYYSVIGYTLTSMIILLYSYKYAFKK